MVNVERAEQYMDIPPEEAANKATDSSAPSVVPLNWPHAGTIDFVNVSLAYRGAVFALRNISFRVLSGQHVGIVGRTGAGKSSLIQVRMRHLKIPSFRTCICF